MKTEIILAIIIILGVIFAWYLIGDIALGGLLTLFGLGTTRKVIAEKINTLKSNADEHEDISDHLVDVATKTQQEADKIDTVIKEVTEKPVDYEKPIESVISHAKKDWL